MALRHRTESISAIEDKLRVIIDQLAIPSEKLKNLQSQIAKDCETQLSIAPGGRKRMLETFIKNCPNGNEQGEFIVLDFGGRFFRVVYVKLNHIDKTTARKKCSIGKSLTIKNDFFIYFRGMCSLLYDRSEIIFKF